MPLKAQTRTKLGRLADADRAAQAAATRAREQFLAALVAARPDATVRELAEVVGISPGRVHELVTVRNRATAAKRAARES